MSRKPERKGSEQTEPEKEQKAAAPSAEIASEAEAAASAEPAEIELLAKELEKEKTLSEDYKRKWYSVSAEYENYRKRTAFQSAQRYQDGRADVIGKLFPIADNLERALASCTDEATKKGIQMVTAAFEKILSDEKIVAIDPLGQPFDAEKHEAIMAVDAKEGEESGTVAKVYLKGYEREGKVLRFAQVVVVK